MQTEYFLFVHYTTSILAKPSTWCFEHSGDISYSLLIDPSLTDESWEGRNMSVDIYALNLFIEHLENMDENRIFFVCSPHHKHFGKPQHVVI